MTHTNAMLVAHPRSPDIEPALLTSCIQACFDALQSCTACADACLSEPTAGDLVRCIRLNEDCADVCLATGRVLSRLTESNHDLLDAMLKACACACEVCAQECERHEGDMEHCRLCALACRNCERACGEALNALRA
ncbi:MAG TPA: four-helix bundle copper-binding protein [Trueperaceae bacterium]